MFDLDEAARLAKNFSDSFRKTVVKGEKALIPHKFAPDGEVLHGDLKEDPEDPEKVTTQSNFDARRDISKLNMDDLRFLVAWREANWNMEKAAIKTNLEVERAKKIKAKLAYFEFEDIHAKALSKIPTTEWVTAKHVENIYQKGALNDSERDSLKELAKINGAYKPLTQVTLTQNIWNMPIPPGVEAKFKALAQEALEAEVVS